MADKVNLNGIKDDLVSLLNTNNTTTSSYDLSASMSQRVKKVLSVHPDMIRPQASFFPFVTCFMVEKNIISEDIAKDQLSAKRVADVTFEIVGGVFNQNGTNLTQDPADRDINYLMENVELILRTNYNMNTKIKWQRPDSVRYFNTALDSVNHIRAGILRLTGKVIY